LSCFSHIGISKKQSSAKNRVTGQILMTNYIPLQKVTTSQRMAESSVLDAHTTDVDGEPYWYYEYIVRKSPTKSAPEPNLFRHNVACTAERDGFLYSLNASTLSKQWESMGPLLQKAVASFHLLPPTEKYVPPYQDPWRFW
uniref:PsbP C-terminal domain-containing protein n=1 Tax=Aegilops tauschii subsp. strangulata TaxID=200361 RepID=A0A453T4I3_AEGTS